jgi:hypothetical protein
LRQRDDGDEETTEQQEAAEEGGHGLRLTIKLFLSQAISSEKNIILKSSKRINFEHAISKNQQGWQWDKQKMM